MSPTAAQPAPSTSATAADGFQPVAANTEPTGAETALIAAYAVMWVLVLGFVWLTFRRQQRLQTRIADLERALADAPPPDEETSS